MYSPVVSSDDKMGDFDRRFVMNQLKKRNCLVCRGIGHYSHECTTKARIDQQFKRCDISCEWGQIKSQIMTENYFKKAVIYKTLMKEKIDQSKVPSKPFVDLRPRAQT